MFVNFHSILILLPVKTLSTHCAPTTFDSAHDQDESGDSR